MDLIAPLLLIVGGILAASSLIVAKKPDAKALIDKLVPFQGGIGAALLVFGLWNLLHAFGTPSIFDLIKIWPLFGISVLGVIVCAVLLGIMFGMPMVGRFSASGAAKGEELAKKLAPFQLLIGIAGIVSAVIFLLYRFEILKLSF